MSRLSKQVDHDKKVAELNSKVQEKAKELQNVTESVDSANLELRQIGERKATLAKVLITLEHKIKEKEQYFGELIAKEEILLTDIKRDLARENLTLEETKALLSQTVAFLDEKQKVATETSNFLDKESKAREKYLQANEELSFAEKNLKEITQKVSSAQKTVEQNSEQMDAYKQYLIALYGKLATYVSVAKETLEYVNKHLEETGTPLKFEIPPDQVVEITIDNFIKHLENHG